MTTDDLTKRITRLEDIEAIKQLKARYCAVCDTGHDPERIVTLFTEDGIWDGGKDFGVAQGHAAIAKLFAGLHELISFCQHNAMNPIIDVNGDRAKAFWYLLCPYTSRKGNHMRWIAANYDDDHVKVDGEWKYSHLRAIIRFHSARSS
jgi:SnoaL-like domain